MNKTALHSMHIAAGARMVPFAGYDMPVQYTGIKAEHLHTRTYAGLFDVSHMGQLSISGSEVVRELEYLLPVDLETMTIGQQRYTFFTLENGGILDDLIIARTGEQSFYLVVNASRKVEDLAHLNQYIENSTIKRLDDFSLLALQGPMAAKALVSVFPELEENVNSLKFMRSISTVLDVDSQAVEVRISRGGYTGEDGFELSIPNDSATSTAQQLVANGIVQWVGLGARDSLRLEAGLCLYGHDLDTDTTPVEAGLNWSITPSRRVGGEKSGGFIGADIILQQLDKGVKRIRQGFLVDGKSPVREGAIIVDDQNVACGRVTSGGFSPTLNRAIFMSYIDTLSLDNALKNDKPLYALVRAKKVPVTPCKMPFVAKGSASV